MEEIATLFEQINTEVENIAHDDYKQCLKKFLRELVLRKPKSSKTEVVNKAWVTDAVNLRLNLPTKKIYSLEFSLI